MTPTSFNTAVNCLFNHIKRWWKHIWNNEIINPHVFLCRCCYAETHQSECWGTPLHRPPWLKSTQNVSQQRRQPANMAHAQDWQKRPAPQRPGFIFRPARGSERKRGDGDEEDKSRGSSTGGQCRLSQGGNNFILSHNTNTKTDCIDYIRDERLGGLCMKHFNEKRSPETNE